MLTAIKSRTSNLKLEHLILSILITYVTLHLIDEGLFGFAAWAEARWHIPNYTTPKWLLHNVYFIFFLGLGTIIYWRNTEKFLPLGLGVAVWGLMNALSHIIFSIIFLEYSPGLLTGFLFLFFGVLVFQRGREMGLLSGRVMALSILSGLLYWGLPIVLFIEIDKLIGI